MVDSSFPAVAATNCGYGEWVLALCITFGILFLIMLIVNIVMCSAVSCNCTRKDQTEEVHPDAWGEYDTVKNVWSNSMSGGSIPGDRHSVHSVAGGPIGSQYQPRGPSPYYHPRGPVMQDDGEIRESRSYTNSAPAMSYGDHYAMVHRNGMSTKYWVVWFCYVRWMPYDVRVLHNCSDE